MSLPVTQGVQLRSIKYQPYTGTTLVVVFALLYKALTLCRNVILLLVIALSIFEPFSLLTVITLSL
jgi:hypothetical protein